MQSDDRRRRLVSAREWWCAIVGGTVMLAATAWPSLASAGCECGKTWPHLVCRGHVHGPTPATVPGDGMNGVLGSGSFQMESPEQEHRAAMNIFNRLCIRCHGVDGRGAWDISDIPDFTNHVWQATRPEDYRSRVILEGRGAIMPSFRGQVTLQEAWALARYVRTLEPVEKVTPPNSRPVSSAPAPGPVSATPAPTTPAGPVKMASTPELRARIDQLAAVVRAGAGVAKNGKAIFDQRCLRCHTLFGKGGRVGPDLTTYRREDLDNLLLHVVDPTADVRQGFVASIVATFDGQITTGVVVKEDKNSVVLRGEDGKETTLERSQIEDLHPSPRSLMPEGLLNDLNDQQARDLFAYLRASQPPAD